MAIEVAGSSQLDDDPPDLRAHPPHQRRPGQQQRHIPHHHRIIDLEPGEAILGVAELAPQPLQCDQVLVALGEQVAGVAEGELALPGEHDRNGPLLLAHRQHRDRQVLRQTLGGAEPGTGLAGLDGRVGDELDVGADDAGGVGGDDDAAVHLRQLGDPLGGELGVAEEEPAAADGIDFGAGAENHQRTGSLPEDQLGRVAQPGSGRELFDNLE